MAQFMQNALNAYLSLQQNERANMDNQRAEKNQALREQEFMQNTDLRSKQMEKLDLDMGRTRLQPFVAAMLSKYETGEQLTPEDMDVFFQYSEVDPYSVTKPEYYQGLKTLESAIKGEISANDPKVLSAANLVWGPKVKRAVGQKAPDGRTIKDQEIIKVVPAPGNEAVMFQLRNYLEEGGYYDEAMTEFRSSDAEADPNVKQVPLDSVIQNIQGQQWLYEFVNQDTLKSVMEGYYAGLGGGKSRSLTLQERKDLETHKYNLKNGKGDSSKSEDEKTSKIDEMARGLVESSMDDTFTGTKVSDPAMARIIATMTIAPERLTAEQKKVAEQHGEMQRLMQIQMEYEATKKELSKGLLNLGASHQKIAADMVRRGVIQDVSEVDYMNVNPSEPRSNNLSTREENRSQRPESKPSDKSTFRSMNPERFDRLVKATMEANPGVTQEQAEAEVEKALQQQINGGQ